MSQTVTTAEKIRLLNWNIAYNAFNNVFATLIFFGSSFVLFVSALGMSNAQIGFLLALLPLTGIVAPFIATRVARFGYKRTYVTFFGIRKIVTAGLLLVPFIMGRFGQSATLTFVTIITAGFALCRSISETGLYPWTQEYIPNSVRGKHSAINDMVARVTGIAAIAFAGYILGVFTSGLDGYMILFAVALVFGVASWWSLTHIPGGAPVPDAKSISARDYLAVLRDKNFVFYMVGLGLVIFANTPLGFLPIFMTNQVRLDDSATVLLQLGPVIGGFTATYLFGWASDRYGSKPIMLLGLYMKLALPFAWMLMPRNSPLSLTIAMAIAFVWGIAEIAWAIGSGRLLFVRVVPYEKRSEYMAVYYALVGIMGAISGMVGGVLLDSFAGVSGKFLIFPLDPFTPMFIGAVILLVASIVLFNRVQADSNVSIGEFAGMFVHGNPVLAFGSLIGYYRARDERAAVASTERMGTVKSPLTVDELLEALKDPRFNVRFEAIISIARQRSDPRLVKALTGILDGTELSLGNIAAWALGRMGDEEALPSLRRGLSSPYRSIQAHCARSLGTLNDQEIAPILLERLQNEKDKGLRNAYASALGNLRSVAALDTLFEIMEETENEGARMEIALAVARVLGGEHHFIQLLRRMRQDKGTTAAQVVSGWKRKLEKLNDADLLKLVNECSERFASDQMDEGALLLGQIIARLPRMPDDSIGRRILDECSKKLVALKMERFEYLLLALCAIQMSEQMFIPEDDEDEEGDVDIGFALE